MWLRGKFNLLIDWNEWKLWLSLQFIETISNLLIILFIIIIIISQDFLFIYLIILKY